MSNKLDNICARCLLAVCDEQDINCELSQYQRDIWRRAQKKWRENHPKKESANKLAYYYRNKENILKKKKEKYNKKIKL